MDKREIVVFDFDGTLTTKDTLLEFIKFSHGKFSFYMGLLLNSPILIAYKLKIYPNWKAKQALFTYFFHGISYSEFQMLCVDFASKIEYPFIALGITEQKTVQYTFRSNLILKKK